MKEKPDDVDFFLSLYDARGFYLERLFEESLI
jgi:hypothetical protein